MLWTCGRKDTCRPPEAPLIGPLLGGILNQPTSYSPAASPRIARPPRPELARRRSNCRSLTLPRRATGGSSARAGLHMLSLSARLTPTEPRQANGSPASSLCSLLFSVLPTPLTRKSLTVLPG